MRHILSSLSVLALMTSTALAQDARNDAAAATSQANDALFKELPFGDTTDFTNAHKGVVAALPAEVIRPGT